MKKTKYTIEQMRNLAEAKGGQCLSEEYINLNTPLLWQCKEGHQWLTKPANIIRSWCPQCAKNAKDTIENMQRLAQAHGGQCLSTQYINTETKLRWQCQAGHQWEAVPQSIKQGTWCPVCSHHQKLTLEEIQAIAMQRGGKCLSKEYINSKTKLLWECSEGHQWQAVLDSVKRGSWCAVCKKTKKKTIEEMQALAQQHGGQCLSTTYTNRHTALRWQCEYGHEWETAPANVLRGYWCPICAGHYKGYKQPRRTEWQIEDMCSIAKERGGLCLSKKYQNVITKLQWQCAKGHQWSAMPSSILNGNWCPTCAGLGKTIDDMQAIAKARGGQCLSEAYINDQTKLLWECSEGHQWWAKSSNIIHNQTWCPVCSGEKAYENNQIKPRWDIEKMQQLAQARGGECLSEQYYNNKTKLRWRCQAQHEWEAIPSQIIGGGWCPTCRRESLKKYSLDSVRQLAQERGGELLSQQYVNSGSKLDWRCQAGHQWSAPLSRILSGHWCPACANNQKKTIEEMQQVAKARYGECLSKEYVNSETPLRWRCHKGHEWEATPSNVVRRKTWCPICSKKQKKTIDDMHILAKNRGGLCLSETYVNSSTKLRWQCHKGHEWEAKPAYVVQGTWCPHCYRETRKLMVNNE